MVAAWHPASTVRARTVPVRTASGSAAPSGSPGSAPSATTSPTARPFSTTMRRTGDAVCTSPPWARMHATSAVVSAPEPPTARCTPLSW